MREILFKAKRIDNGEWVEGWLFKTQEHSYIAYDRQFDDDLFLSPQNIFIEVDTNTICQYTGLTGKNGNKIWENDICSTDIKRPYAIVEFRNGCFMYNLNDGEEDYYDIIVPIEPLVNSDKYTEVIGNIFDNPELVERN